MEEKETWREKEIKLIDDQLFVIDLEAENVDWKRYNNLIKAKSMLSKDDIEEKAIINKDNREKEKRLEEKKLNEKKPNFLESKAFENITRFVLPIIGSTAVTIAYLKKDDPSSDGKTWFGCLKDMFKPR